MENGLLIGSSSPNGLYQNFPNFDKFPIQGSSSSTLSLGVLAPFYDPFDPFQPSSINGCSNNRFHLNASIPSGSNGANHVMHGGQNVGFLNYPPRILLEALNQGQNFQPKNYQAFGSTNVNLSDEVSCLTKEGGNRKKVESKRRRMHQKRTKKVHQTPIIVKGQWATEEDRLLVQLVKEYGEKKWSHIAQMLNGRMGKQCRERWHNHLRPDIKKDLWSEEEEMKLIEVHRQIGNKWAAIAREMPGRTENTIKNHWNATKRRRFSKRKGQYSSLLQDYIKSLPSDSTVNDGQKGPSSDSNLRILDNTDLEEDNKDQKGPTSDSDKVADYQIYEKMAVEEDDFGSMLNESNKAELVMEMKMMPAGLMDKEMSFDLEIKGSWAIAQVVMKRVLLGVKLEIKGSWAIAQVVMKRVLLGVKV
ncbi:transcription factor MYB98-like [Camellia sinensis]|uniref:transcription factor MYB98-like n=1 Tax=Camellia sinensis TaxID=4442 RepID=UPI001036ABEA|nr:transcription factor MYB98-like [Camellia sinensis]